MADATDRSRHFVQHEPVDPWVEFLSQFDGFFFMFCTIGLGFVIASQYARHRRRRENLKKMRAYWEEQRQATQFSSMGTNPRLRYDQGFWGEGK